LIATTGYGLHRSELEGTNRRAPSRSRDQGGKNRQTAECKQNGANSIGGGCFGHSQSLNGMLVGRRDDPTRRIAENAADQLSMQGVSRLMCCHTAEERQAHQGQISDQIERFVAPKFVRIAERTVQNAILGEDDGIVERTSTDESHRTQWLNVAFKTERAGSG